jgi:acyl-CoA thioester hydrolase
MHSRSYITVRYAETDRMGIAHHSNYPVWFEVGRTDFIKMFGTTYSDMENAGVMLPLVNLTCHFIQPALYEDELIVRTWCIHMTAARIEFAYSVKRINPDGSETELGYGTTEHGIVDSKTFRPCNIKKRLPVLYDKINGNIKEY